MVPMSALWLPIVLSAIIVFVVSSLIHMLLKYHNSDHRKLPQEDKILAALRPANLEPGLYVFPHSTHKDMKSPEMMEKFKQGPVGFLTIRPSGPVALGKFLGQWFGFCLVVGAVAALLAVHVLPFGATYKSVFHVVGLAAFLGYGIGPLSNGIWKGQPWSSVAKEVFDGLIYGLLTGGTFGWLWPR
jgi:hypothetical protein